MTMNDEQLRLSVVLRETAQSFDPPDLDVLCENAVHRGRRTIVRRRAVGVGIGMLAMAGVALGATAAVTVSHPATGLGPTVTVVTTSKAGLGEYLATSFMALLPAGIKLLPSYDAPLQGEGYRVGGPSTGDWVASASVLGTYQGKNASFDLELVQQATDGSCMTSTPSANSYACTTSTLDGHRLLTEKTIRSGVPVSWRYSWNVGGGKAVELTLNRDLPESVVAKVLTASAWTSVLRGLPAYVDCPSLVQITGAADVVWKCPTTGKTYPTKSNDMYIYQSS